MKNVLLDTNCYSLFLKGDKPLVKEIIRANKIYFSVISIGELYSGFFRGSRFGVNVNLLKKFINDEKVEVLKVTKETARIYGEVSVLLFKTGIPRPTNDIWIAAHAIETDSVLITYDKHFLKIPGVKLWKNL